MEGTILVLRKNKSFTFICMLALVLVTIGILAPYIAPHDPLKTDMINSLKGPNSMFPLGTDQLGRDLFSRILHGALNSLKMTFSLVILVFIIGTALGTLAGYFGGMIDTIVMRFCDIFLAFPGIIFAIAVAGVLGPSSINTVIVLAVVNWPKYARLSRGLAMSIRKKDYIKAAKMGGANEYQIIMRYVLPNIIPSLIVTVAMDIGTMLLEISSLSFLGLGAQPPTPEWGYMINEGRAYIQTAPWLMIYPGIAMFITVTIFNLLGENIRDILDPNKEYERK
ncbi:nickel transporter permease [Clostridium saccharobutylicum]|uniref:Glutathione transport system permease protein GsiD n=1 Tax=Clostridium saccharobutylicum DSM 13864 TaxID=1345695 RepID=U5MTV2_CLOSA|nr:nickel transporter permease [Clostridium saccharobutylicum]AGX43091.1 glutathione transport system permease protein GsiD [Clostridium saccharobutylicum DSM 13864]AQR90386.1 glutathione transport system permease protein GsiD [Clostridium saccharobutylicum]AQS00292.1 glutathione transport system permease protein GsiD [Clostridium saccharobutylicum]AQS14275.1 glutathione transport system permease protein GsiD [Clostridium saccharobutylicum]MBA2907044.1 peptide/nickel transport system permease 